MCSRLIYHCAGLLSALLLSLPALAGEGYHPAGADALIKHLPDRDRQAGEESGGHSAAAMTGRLAVVFYQKFISPQDGPVCRFRPTCSAYAAQAMRSKGFFRGIFYAADRLIRDHPFAEAGDDPVDPVR